MIVKFLLGMWIGFVAQRNYAAIRSRFDALDPAKADELDDAYEAEIEKFRKVVTMWPRGAWLFAHVTGLLVYLALPLCLLGLLGFFR